MTQTRRPEGSKQARLLAVLSKGAVIAAPLFFAGAAPAMQQGPQIPDSLEEISFADLTGWQQDDHRGALNAFLRHCSKPNLAKSGPALLHTGPYEISRLCAAGRNTAPDFSARLFFETHFTPFQVSQSGFVTGYFEPELTASRIRTDRFIVPLHQKPAGLEAITPENRPHDWPAHLSHGRRSGKSFTEMPDRSAIMDGALDAEELELVWLEDPIDAYYIHVQGSARLRLTDGSVMRVGYAGKTGHPYTGIGRQLVRRGEGTPEDFTMSGLRAWLVNNPDKRDALFKENRSYIFFREVRNTKPAEGRAASVARQKPRNRSTAHPLRCAGFRFFGFSGPGITGTNLFTPDGGR
ncbi:MltA domain-containing protein [Roseibium sp.]|uniref:MltA domain-containing protein n=1 Tax=Roseibium sp. TaxID=1936156 RepID=UPI002624C2B9|nr:MltA domain-containing protein [Roseibium sp.]